MRVLRTNCGGNQRWRRSLFILLGALCLGSSSASAVNFPVSGTITVNGNAGALPAGGVFGPSSYDAASGAIALGAFSFPQATTSFSSTLGLVVVTYQLSQTNMSSGQVASDGVAALTDATMKLQVIHVTISGIPVPVGTCVFQPIDVALTGTGSAAGLDLSDSGFVIPPVAPTDCGGYGNDINNAIAGSNNSIQMHLAGDFTPPAASDTIFANGFDPAGGL
jgi:hypothetical protein